MAENDIPNTQPKVKAENEEKGLEYLEFVQVVASYIILYSLKVFGYVKDNSGPLKPSMETVEDTFKTVAAPAYNKFQDVPVEVLKFFDRKVGESVTKLDSHMQPLVEQVSSKAKSLTNDIANTGVVETASGLAKTAYTKLEPTAKELYTMYEPTAKELYTKYEPVAEQYATSSWKSLNQLPFFPEVAKVVVPSASFVSEKYNQTVQQTVEKGYKVSSFLPLVPTEKIAKVFTRE